MCPEDAIVGFVFIVIPLFFLMMYILMARDCCYETAGSQRQEQEEVETVEQEDLHEQVMGIMFPGQQRDDDNTILKSDPTSSNNNNESDTNCSICLENFEPGDLVVSSTCLHEFHRDCVMLWLKIKKHHGCPYCRQRMWTQETYDFFTTEIRQAGGGENRDSNTGSGQPQRQGEDVGP